LATHVDMEDVISEYAATFQDGFADNWFENLVKGRQKFQWEHLESAVTTKFIPRNYIQRLNAIKQNGRSVAEYIVERERLESAWVRRLPKA
jgi:Retrotransposon gag protein